MFEPFGPQIEWLQSAQIASTIANVNRSRSSRTITPQDVMPKEPKLQRVQTVEEMRAAMTQIFEASKRAGFPKTSR